MDTFESLGGSRAAISKLYENTAFKHSSLRVTECKGAFQKTVVGVLLEGIDFDLTFFPFKHLGYKAALQASGELFASGAKPAVLDVTIGVSSKLDYPQVAQIWEGLCAGAKDFSYTDLHLALKPSLTGLSISFAASGFCDEKQVKKRPKAKSMDLICISDNVGASFLGDQILRKCKDLPEADRLKKLEGYKQLVGAYLKPSLSPYVLSSLEDSQITPSCGFFCKESLRETIYELCSATGLGAKIYVEKLPLAGGSVDCAKQLGLDPLQAALRGGDDCCMLYTVPIGCHERFRHDFQSWDVIGHLAKPETGAVLVSPDGLEHTL